MNTDTVAKDQDGFIKLLESEDTFRKVIMELNNFSFHKDLMNQSPVVFEQVSEITQKCIFHKKYKAFNSYLNGDLENKENPEDYKFCKTLFKFFSKIYHLKDEETNYGFKLIFHAFSKAYKDFGLTYRMLVILIDLIGFDIREKFQLKKIKVQISPTSLNKSLSILKNLLEVLVNLQIEADCKLNEITFIEFMRDLLKSIVSLTGTPNTVCYQIMLKTIEIHPLIIEPILSDLIIYAMLADNTKFRSEYEEFMLKILEVFAKLHRIQHLISKMVPTLKAGLEDRKLNETVYNFKGESPNLHTSVNMHYDVDLIFPKTVLNYFTQCITTLASWQVMNLFKTLLFHLDKSLDDLAAIEEETRFIYVDILSALTCWLLSSVRMAEHTVGSTTVAKFVGGLEELRSILNKFGTALLHKEHNHMLMRAFLNICFNWGEIYMTLTYYSINNEVEMKKNAEFTSSNLTYLHNYLTAKQWCSISERITNFGEDPCKEAMQRLFVQIVRAFLIFENSVNEDLINEIVKNLVTNSDNYCVEILTDKFVVRHMLNKMPPSVIMHISEAICDDLIDGKKDLTREAHIYDCPLITKGVLCVLFTRICKFLRQKRKHDDVAVKKGFCARILSILPANPFLVGHEELTGEISQILLSPEELKLDLKVSSGKIRNCFEIMRKLPVIFCDEATSRLLLMLLFASHRDVVNSNCNDDLLKQTCESLILGILQHSKFNLIKALESKLFFKVIIENFDRYEELFSFCINKLKSGDESIDIFQQWIDCLKDNLKEFRYMRCAVIVLNFLTKILRSKQSGLYKEACLKHKSTISNTIVRIIRKNPPRDDLIEPYALALKTFLGKDENDNLTKLQTNSSEYVDFALNNLSSGNMKGCLLLFLTILHHKANFAESSADLPLKIWESLKRFTIEDENLEDYSQLVVLIISLVPNEDFSLIINDLYSATEKAIEANNLEEIRRHLRTWTCILTTNFNPVKLKALREELAKLLLKLVELLKCGSEDLLEEIVQFQVSIIQTNHLPLSPSIVDLFLVAVPFLMLRNDLVPTYILSISILNSLLKHRNPLIMDRLPAYLQQYRILLRKLCTKSNSELNLGTEEVQKVANCAHLLEKLTKGLVACSRDMARISPYLIADILEQYEQITICPSVKIHLNNCIYSLISLCDQHAVQYLMRVLSNASTEIFKIMFGNYKKYYRFTGKV